MSRLVYITALSPDECLQRLQARASKRLSSSAWSPPEEGTVAAKLRANRFRLFAQGQKYVRNSFVPFFYGRVEASREGTRIIGSFRMHPFVHVFLAIWFGGLAVMAVVFPVVAFSGNVQGGKPPFVFVVGPVLMMLLGVGLVAVGRRLSRGQIPRLREFLREELKATPILS
jgi:hypothetical protein